MLRQHRFVRAGDQSVLHQRQFGIHAIGVRLQSLSGRRKVAGQLDQIRRAVSRILDDPDPLVSFEEIEVGDRCEQQLLVKNGVCGMAPCRRGGSRNLGLKDSVGHMKLGQNPGNHWRSSSYRPCTEPILKGVPIDVLDVAAAGLQISVVPIEAESGADRRQPECTGGIEPRVGLLNAPLCQPDCGVLTVDHRKHGR